MSICQDLVEQYPDFNVLCAYTPPCIIQHGHVNLTLNCFLQSIKSSNKKLMELILNAQHHLEQIKKLDVRAYCLNIFQHKIFLIRTCLAEIDKCVQALAPKSHINLTQSNNFTNFAQNLLLGAFIYIKNSIQWSNF